MTRALYITAALFAGCGTQTTTPADAGEGDASAVYDLAGIDLNFVAHPDAGILCVAQGSDGGTNCADPTPVCCLDNANHTSRCVARTSDCQGPSTFPVTCESDDECPQGESCCFTGSAIQCVPSGACGNPVCPDPKCPNDVNCCVPGPSGNNFCVPGGCA